MKNHKIFCIIILLFFSLLFGCKTLKDSSVNNKNFDNTDDNINLDNTDDNIIRDKNSNTEDNEDDGPVKIVLPSKSEEEIREELIKLNEKQPQKYRIKSGDVFNVYIDADPNFNTLSAIVKSDGYISIKRLGEIQIEGLTINEAKEKIDNELSRYIKIYPRLSLIPVKIKEASVNVLGEVKKPGVYSIEGSKRLLDVISEAGGLAILELDTERVEIADLESAYIVRDNKILPVDFIELIVKANNLHNILLKDRDYIYIPSYTSKNVYILGEVNSPGKYMLTKDLSLSKLVAEAGGVKTTSAMNLLIVRGNLKKPLIYKVNLRTILKRGEVDFALKRDDIIFVPRSGMQAYNDVINNILPTLNLITSTTGAFINVDTTRTIIKGYGDEE